MNYRGQQIRHILKQHQQKWDLEKQTLQQDIVNLANSADVKVVRNLEKRVKEKEKLLSDTINLLGSEDIKNLTDLKNLLQGQTLKELIANHKQELKESKKQVQTLTTANEKLAKEKDSLVLEKNNWNEKLEQVKQEQQDNLRKINVLFDIKAVDYDTIDFNGLYSLLSSIAERERERERERETIIPPSDDGKKRKKKKNKRK